MYDHSSYAEWRSKRETQRNMGTSERGFESRTALLDRYALKRQTSCIPTTTRIIHCPLAPFRIKSQCWKLYISPILSVFLKKMCYNIVDGRFHTECLHFHPMATYKQDCLKENCVFSTRHTHSYCKSPNCIRMMAQPVQNPIRFSPTPCVHCRARDGTFGHR
ncbi:hypothetical protein GYMLUDRAFT_666771 [Collybiopsis luxurians FD-317 M1]|uniref:Uncharacterized protein n=1 Tax=Collybiopsis luxurians FD-317 M1 TaxID=944289 RepID=A0A0D0CBN4_9AGAR|nr:hypothetical protein GYMLUDRAFT_666771 [Collybiopsis luxurians FD-317 M1]